MTAVRAAGAVVLVAALMCVLWSQLIVFHRRHRAAMWRPEKPAQSSRGRIVRFFLLSARANSSRRKARRAIKTTQQRTVHS